MTRWPGRETLLLLALVLIAWASVDNYGTYSDLAFDLAVCAAVAACLAVRANPSARSRSYVWVIAVTALAAENLAFRKQFPSYLDGGRVIPLGTLVIALSASVMVAMLRVNPTIRKAAIAIAFLMLGLLIALPWRWGYQGIDVFAAITNATSALLHGHSPYSSSFPLYAWTWPGVGAGHIHTKSVPFQYGPLVSIFAIPGYLLGDVRFSSLLATAVLVIAVWMAARNSDSPSVRLGAPLAVAVMPFTLGMILQTWVDVYMMAGFAGWLVLRRRHPRLAVVCLASCLLVKPTVGIAVLPPFVWLRSARREGLVAAGLATALLVPFAFATGPERLWQDVIGLQTSMPPRVDGLTVLSDLYRHFGIVMPTMLRTVLTGLSAVALLRRRPTDMSDLLARGAALSLIAFLFAKWAFFNYYYVPALLLSLALSFQGGALDPEDVALPIPQRLLRHDLRRRLSAKAPSFDPGATRFPPPEGDAAAALGPTGTGR